MWRALLNGNETIIVTRSSQNLREDWDSPHSPISSLTEPRFSLTEGGGYPGKYSSSLGRLSNMCAPPLPAPPNGPPTAHGAFPGGGGGFPPPPQLPPAVFPGGGSDPPGSYAAFLGGGLRVFLFRPPPPEAKRARPWESKGIATQGHSAGVVCCALSLRH